MQFRAPGTSQPVGCRLSRSGGYFGFWAPVIYLRIVFFCSFFPARRYTVPVRCADPAPVVRWVVDSFRVSVGLGALLSSIGAVGGMLLACDRFGRVTLTLWWTSALSRGSPFWPLE